MRCSLIIFQRVIIFQKRIKACKVFSLQFLEDIFEKMFLTSSKHRTNSLKSIDNTIKTPFVEYRRAIEKNKNI